MCLQPHISYLHISVQVLSRKKMSDLLAELRAMIHDLKSCIHVSSDGLLGQYYHLLVVLGHEELTSKFYNPIDSGMCGSCFVFVRFVLPFRF